MRRLAVLFFLFLAAFSSAQANPLPVDEAFALSVTRSQTGGLTFEWRIADGYYLYRDHIEASLSGLGQDLPVETEAGVQKDDPTFGATEVYYGYARAAVPVLGETPIDLTYQGCQDDGICYRPETRTIDPVTLAIATPSAGMSAPTSVWTGEPLDATPGLETALPDAPFVLAEDQGLIPSLLDRGGVFLVLAAFPIFGLLLAFTPCVFPMYPIMAGALAREGGRLTPKRGFILSSIYVLSLAAGFGLLGAIAGWSGQNLQMVLQSPLMTGAVALIFSVLALSMFGLFELQFPASWTSLITRKTGGIGGSKRSAAVLGFSSVLIVGPCVTAPLAGALLYIAQTADVKLGAAALFGLGIGKGLPLVILGTMGGGALPRAGAWMESVRQLFGFGFLATAIWMAAPLLPSGVELFLWAALLIGFGTYAFATWPATRSGFVAARAVSIMAIVYGVVLTVGAAAGSTDPLKPLAVLAGRSEGGQAADLSFAQVASTDDFQNTLVAAKGNKPTMIYFTADWCVTCHVIERSVLSDPEVKRSLGGFNLIKADLSDVNAANTALMEQLRVAGPPTMVFFDAAAREASGTRLVGTVTIDKLTGSAERTRGL